ncbi:MAG: adenosylcobinamide-phosphate synthase CbiB [Actinobacteria bacterium]|jgi:adenosylcobinamide-phosphate synthase|nr:adenosylcobinamide-phosphate synthase CbiB [Actinomycetota bacterium]MCL6095955.1 adenosylcobinamide-phosphate synthase CbiB [Actinomycetota bacterium]
MSMTSAVLGMLADRLLPEPPERIHPLVAYGRIMMFIERLIFDDSRLRGLIYTVLGAALGGLAGRIARSNVTMTYLSCGGHALRKAAMTIQEDLERGDPATARRHLLSLVGRDVDGLDEEGIIRAVVESVAENTVDAVVAPGFWSMIGGAVGTAFYRAVNTMDAMVGYKNDRYKRFGWASAKLDDVCNFVPARLTALLVALVRPSSAWAVWEGVREFAPAHPSPNAGVVEAAFASVLGVRLGGLNYYQGVEEHRPLMGRGRTVEIQDIEAAVKVLDEVTLAYSALILFVHGLFSVRRRIAR